MGPDLDHILDQIYDLREQIEQHFKDAEQQFRYSLKDGRVAFADKIKAEHKEYKTALFTYLRNARAASIVTAPVIYFMIVPIALLDVMVTVYQHFCFRMYKIPRVSRKDYLINDRHQLGYLNTLERINCAYCGYANGVISYGREVLSRTEQYWCPIRHANRIADSHKRYTDFCDFGDAKGYKENLVNLRQKLRQE